MIGDAVEEDDAAGDLELVAGAREVVASDPSVAAGRAGGGREQNGTENRREDLHDLKE